MDNNQNNNSDNTIMNSINTNQNKDMVKDEVNYEENNNENNDSEVLINGNFSLILALQGKSQEALVLEVSQEMEINGKL